MICRLALDTDVIVAGMRSPSGASAELLRRIRSGRAIMLASVPLFVEYEAVTTRHEHVSGSGATRDEVENFLNIVAALVEPVETHFLWRPQLRDADDEMILEAAVNGRADGIVTFNARDYGATSDEFGIETLPPAMILRRV
ncbi:putative toxin-antitoxin system toxin component, PIN family [Inquilinus sp. CAU 1745]|uniref:putative toxin-antitoxin system toxin component, PIN family n=1 Tax=Inquilinus sp. CAU 1745 TaxID=3140369 RepID=UPI00325AC3D2